MASNLPLPAPFPTANATSHHFSAPSSWSKKKTSRKPSSKTTSRISPQSKNLFRPNSGPNKKFPRSFAKRGNLEIPSEGLVRPRQVSRHNDAHQRYEAENNPPDRFPGNVQHQNNICDWNPGQPTILRIRLLRDGGKRQRHIHIHGKRENKKKHQKSACKQRRQSSRSFVLRKRRGRQNRRHSYQRARTQQPEYTTGYFHRKSSTQRRLDVIRGTQWLQARRLPWPGQNAFTELCLNCP